MMRRALPHIARLGAGLLLMSCYGSVPAPTNSEDVTTTPEDATTTPEDATTTPEDATTTPEDTTTPPGADVETLADATCAPRPEVTAEPGQIAASTRNRLTWKRVDTLQRDLGRALGTDELSCDDPSYLQVALATAPFAELPKACAVDTSQELGLAGDLASAFTIHNVALGGNDPIELGLYQPAAAPLATTPIAIDRAVMLACIRAIDEDTVGIIGGAGLDLTETTDAHDDATLDTVITLLYQRLLARDPLATELAVMRTLAVDEADAPVSVRDFLVLSCFVTGTTSEFIFY